jgi:predicted ATPase/DNA-binding SARP family transcriptional activator
MDVRWRIELLGRLRVVSESGPAREVTRFRARLTGVLLAYLAVHLDRAHPRDELIELLWPECDPKRGRARLSNELSSLRHALEPPGVPAHAVILADHSSVRLNPATVRSDVTAFHAALRDAERAEDATEQARSLARAIELYGGELLPGHYDEWILLEREWLAERYVGALDTLIRLREQEGDLRDVLELARRAVKADPLREAGHRELIRQLAATGRPRAALRHFEELKRLLREELDTVPEEETCEPVRQIEAQIQEAARRGQLLPDAEEPEAGPEIALAAPAAPLVVARPVGTVTLLLMAIEGAPSLREREGDRSQAILERRQAILHREIQRHGGHELKPDAPIAGRDADDEARGGEGFVVSFHSASDALACALAVQRAPETDPQPAEEPCEARPGELLLRVALHTGDVAPGAPRPSWPDDPIRPVLDHASRILAVSRGGQILCSETTTGVLLRGALGELEPGVQLVDMGVHRLPELPGRGVGSSAVPWPERLFRVEFPGMAPRSFPPTEIEPARSAHLPPRLDRFFGREREIARLMELLRDGHRLVTLTGLGGSGKTRLALQAAEQLASPFHGAVRFVPLADLDDAHGIPERMLEALRLPRSPMAEAWEQVVAALSSQPALIVLDNFEHLVDEGALLVQTLLERVPSLVCLVTSRRRLRLAVEREFPVPPLPIPTGRRRGAGRAGGSTDRPDLGDLAQCESVQLFVDRSQAVRPDFRLSPANAADVAALCRRLEGIPLALELAAARAPVLTPGQVLGHLERRLDVLKSDRRDLPPRQRALQAVFDWSYRLLTEELRRFFARLSVFRGSWSVEAAEAVCEEPLALDYLAQLRDGSLVLAEEEAGEIRFRMLELSRWYAREQLDVEERAALETRHAFCYLTLAEEAEPGLVGAGQVEWLARLEREHDNARAALDWCRAEQQGEWSLRLAGALWKFWLGCGHVREGRRRLEESLGQSGAQSAGRLKALLGAGTLAFYQGDYGAAAELAREAQSLARKLDEGGGLALALILLGWVYVDHHGECDRAGKLFEESLEAARGVEDRFAVSLALQGMGYVALLREEFGLARSLLEQSRTLFGQLGDSWGTSLSLQALGHLALREGDHERARAVYEEVLVLSQKPGYATGIAAALCALGRLAGRRGEPEEAERLLKESLARDRVLGSKQGIVQCLEALAEVAGVRCEAKRAARLLGAASALRETLGIVAQPTDASDEPSGAAAALAELGEPAFTAAWEEGRAMTLEEAISAALEDGSSGEAA